MEDLSKATMDELNMLLTSERRYYIEIIRENRLSELRNCEQKLMAIMKEIHRKKNKERG